MDEFWLKNMTKCVIIEIKPDIILMASNTVKKNLYQNLAILKD